MSVWPGPVSAPLKSAEGDLLSIHITVEAFLLEDLLDALAEAPFPINPEIRHHEAVATVEFPAWQSQLGALRKLLGARRFEWEVSRMLADVVS